MGNNSFQELLTSNNPVLLDGGLGTSLILRGLPVGTGPEMWNLERPQEVFETHRAFVASGSQIIMANTFGANEQRLARIGMAERMKDIIQSGVRLALEAAGGVAQVAQDIGPTGEFLNPLGTLTVEAATESYERAAAAGLEAGARCAWIETMSDITETLAAVEGCRRAGYEHVAVSLTFQMTAAGPRTAMGAAPGQVARMLKDSGIFAMGGNCGEGPRVILEACREMALEAPGLSLIAKPNAGLPRMVSGTLRYDLAPEPFARELLAGDRVSIKFWGGCCGTEPSHIAALRQRLTTRARETSIQK